MSGHYTTLGALTSFICKHDKNIAKWVPSDRNYWIGWMNEQGFLVAICDANDKTIGFVSARPIMKKEEAQTPYLVDQEGEIIYVESIVALSNEVFRALIVALINRFGRRKYVAWKRAKSGERLHLHLASKAVLRVLKPVSI